MRGPLRGLRIDPQRLIGGFMVVNHVGSVAGEGIDAMRGPYGR